MRRPNADTHQLCRSLLQKAVRRGCKDLVEATTRHLAEIGDYDWVRKRAAVITYEECWPLGNDFVDLMDLEETIRNLVK